MTSLKKTGVITSMCLASFVVLFYQNCGKGFVAQNNRLEEISASSTSDDPPARSDDPDEEFPSPQTPSMPDVPPSLPVDGDDPKLPPPIPTTTTTLPPTGTNNPPGAPEISIGLSDRLVLGSPDGIYAEIQMKDPASVQSYEWLIDGQKRITSTPKVKLKAWGQVDVSVSVKGKNGLVSTSRGVISISRFAVINGKLNYYSPQATYVEIPQADASTLKLIGLNTVADASQVYSFYSELTIYKSTNPAAVKELSPSYLRIDGNVYYNGVVIPNAQGASFTVLHDTGYAKDSAKVFCKTAEIVGAHAPSFEMPFKGIIQFARDKNSLYSSCNVLKAYDGVTFSAVKSDLIDPQGWKGLFHLSDKLYFISGSSESRTRSLAIIEVPFLPVAGAQMNIVGEGTVEAMASDPGPLAHEIRLVTDGKNFAIFKYSPPTNKFVLLKSTAQPHMSSFKMLSKSIYVDRDRVYVVDIANDALDVLPNAHASIFASIGGSFYKSGTDLFYISSKGAWKQFSNVDASTFAYVGDGFYKDKGNVYFLKADSLIVLPGATPGSFTKVSYGLYRDGSQAWYANSGIYMVLSGVHVPSLRLITDSIYTSIFADQNKIYLASYDIIARTLQFTSIAVPDTSQIKAQNRDYLYSPTVLYFVGEKEIKPVVGVTPRNLKSYSSCVGSEHSLICNGEIVAGIVADELMSIQYRSNSSSRYYKDANSVYFFSTLPAKLENAQLSTFRLVDPDISDFYATDGIRVWAEKTLLTMADAATFKVKSLLSAEDKNYTYSIDRATKKAEEVVQPKPPPRT